MIEDLTLALMIKQAYKNKNIRKSLINGYTYQKNLSKNFFAIYRNKDLIIIAVRGVSNFKELLVNIKKGLKPDYNDFRYKNFIKDYKEILKIKGKKIFTGHSMGGALISHANKVVNPNEKINVVLFAPYVYNRRNTENKMIMYNKNYKVYYYNLDVVSNKMNLAFGKKNVKKLMVPLLLKPTPDVLLKYHKIDTFIEYFKKK